MNLPYSIAVVLLFSIMLYAARKLTFASLERYSKIVVTMDSHSIGRISVDSNECYPLKDIKRVRIKRTTRNIIREITIIFASGRVLCVNGLDDFESFNDRLLRGAAPGTRITHYREHIDYDHPLFYKCLGVFAGCILTACMRLITLLPFESIMMIQYSILAFNLVAGLIMIAARPTSRRYGKTIKTDYLIGGGILLADVILFIGMIA